MSTMRVHEESKDGTAKKSPQSHKGRWSSWQNMGFLHIWVVGTVLVLESPVHFGSCIQQAFSVCQALGTLGTELWPRQTWCLVKGRVSWEVPPWRQETCTSWRNLMLPSEFWTELWYHLPRNVTPTHNSSKWRGLMTGLTFRKQSRLLCLLWEHKPTANHKTQKGGNRTFPGNVTLQHLLAIHLC